MPRSISRVRRAPLYLFSYGSNHPRQLAERLGREVEGEPAFADGWLRAFRGYSQRWGGGVATLIPGSGRTYGYITPVSEADLDQLDKYEGVHSGKYYRELITVTTADGRDLDAVVYLASSREKNRPSRIYLDAVAETISQFWSDPSGPVTAKSITIRNPNRARRNGARPSLPPLSNVEFNDDLPRLPVEITPKSERLTGRTRDLWPGIKLHEQFSKTNKPCWVTFTDGREVLFLSNNEGKGSYIYRSFSGTSGKQMGFWYPTGGVLSMKGESIWLIKSGIGAKGHRGMGRSKLTEFVDDINAHMPSSDMEVDQWLVRTCGMQNPGWSASPEVETKPVFNLLNYIAPTDPERKAWMVWVKETWKQMGVNTTWGTRDIQ